MVDVRDSFAVLPDDSELLNTEIIRHSISKYSNSRITRFEILNQTLSTNTILLERAQEACIDGNVLMAEFQSGGRGRQGCSWISPFAKNIALSIGVRLDCAPTRISPLSLAIGVVVAEALESIGVGFPQLKWPNDILIDLGKVGGILVELVHISRPVELIVGLGVNVGGGAIVSAHVGNRVADVADYVSNPVRNLLTAELIDRTFLACREFNVKGFSAFREKWLERDAFIGEAVIANVGGKLLEGIDLGVDEEGALMLAVDGEIHKIIGGEVSLRSDEYPS